jgi:beta-1,2-mannobiose phosphorylase / 1,2-beta-oligomannan phosphorylase
VTTFQPRVERLGLVLSPNGDPNEVEGVLNPACARTRGGELLLYPRVVAGGNVSRIGRVRMSSNGSLAAQRDGYALEPNVPYEIRPQPGYGCEDPRVTFVPVLDCYVMAYTAFGPEGPRIALALSDDGIAWERLGLISFSAPGMRDGDDKDAAFFPEPVWSPNGVRCLAMYHRPMFHMSALDFRGAVPMIERLPYEDRESIRIGYIELEAVLKDRKALLNVTESALVVTPNADWGSVKTGAGTPPVRTKDGWLSVFHAVDIIDESGNKPWFRYMAGIVVHDLETPHQLLYRSPQPLLAPETENERVGIVDNVVFPAGIDVRADLGEGVYDIYYGMADYSIGAARMTLG